MWTFVVMGVSGVGKTTVASALALDLAWEFVEADDFHTPQNLAKMRGGHALSDADRAPWLAAVGQRLADLRHSNRRAVVACSALRRSYRDALRLFTADACFAHLDASASTVAARLALRRGGNISPALLATQFETLEPLEPDECGLVVNGDRNVEAVVARLGAWIRWPR